MSGQTDGRTRHNERTECIQSGLY